MSGFLGVPAAAGSGLLSDVAYALGFGGFCAFGPVSIALLGSPEQNRGQARSNFAKQVLLTTRPVLQWTYDDLQTVRMKMRLDVNFPGCIPADNIATLQQLMLSHTPEPLVYGDGSSPGTFVLASIGTEDVWRYPGALQIAYVDLELTEWVPTLPLGAPSQQPTAPTPGVIGSPPGLAALNAVGATLGLPLPSTSFETMGVGAITRAGAL